MIKKPTELFSMRTFLLLLICLIVPVKKIQAQDFSYKVNAMYIYYFAKYIDWADVQTESVTIGIIGDSPVIDQLKAVTANKKVYGKSIVIRKITETEATECNMVIISKSESALTQKISDDVKNLPILLVTEKSGYANKGAQICMYVDDEDDFKTKFQLSKANIKKAHLKVSNDLLTLAVIVN